MDEEVSRSMETLEITLFSDVKTRHLIQGPWQVSGARIISDMDGNPWDFLFRAGQGPKRAYFQARETRKSPGRGSK